MKEIELKDLRREHEKRFLQENGDIVAKVFRENIHFKRNGKYEEIDNTLIKGSSYYTNKNNDYRVEFNVSSEKYFMKMTKDSHHLEIAINNTNTVTAIKENDTDIRYNEIIAGMDLEYKLYPTKVKENMILKNKEVDIDKIIFLINTNLTLELSDNTISALANNEEIFNIEAPYMIDANHEVNNNIGYNLVNMGGIYHLGLLLDKEWLETATYPVTIDPTITNSGQNMAVYDTYIYSGDTNVDRNSQDILKAGVEKVGNDYRTNRALIRFDLPTIGTGSQIREAKMFLFGYPGDILFDEVKIVDVHRVTSAWDEKKANWSTMNDKYDSSRIENYFGYYGNMYSHITGEWLRSIWSEVEITDLVKKWYTDTPNYGVLLKSHKEIYVNDNYPAFFSKDNVVTGTNPQPTLSITYRNENGLEAYMDYQSQVFSDGATHINSYNGNLIGVFNIGSTIGGKLPASLNLIYNTNDVILNNDNGLGNGYKFDLYQTIKEVMIEENKYLEYVDEDGTIHYFYDDDEDGVFNDEDGLNMTVTSSETEYLLTDKMGNNMTFTINDRIGYLTEIKNISDSKIIIIYDNNKIIKVVDANDSDINVAYNTNSITITSPEQTSILSYTDNKISSITALTGETLIEYNNHNIISSITDPNGMSIEYEYYEQTPYRVYRVTQYGLNNTLGSSFTINYGYNLTTITDNKGRQTTRTFNNYANVTSITNLAASGNLKNACAKEMTYGEGGQYKNRLLQSRMPIKYVKNYLPDSSFESAEVLFTANGDVDVYPTSNSFSGTLGMGIYSPRRTGSASRSFVVPKGNFYTFSAYMKYDVHVAFELSYIGSNGYRTTAYEEFSTHPDEEFHRCEITIYYPEDAESDLQLEILLFWSGLVFIDDIQLEEGEVASRYNMISNSDFSAGLNDWDLVARSSESFDDIDPILYFSIVDADECGTKALKVDMSVDVSTGFSKTFVANGKAGDVYQISFWYRNEGIFASGILGDPVCNNVIIAYHYADEDDGQERFNGPSFNCNCSEWQYYSTTFIAIKDFDSFTLDFYQENNINSFYITNICLFKDIRNYSFDYDSAGNLITSFGLNNSPELFNYDTNNQLIKMTTPTGNSLNYEYDNKTTDRVIRGISKSGISNSIEYDEHGNPLITRISSKGPEDITTGTYQIRAKGTNTYVRYASGALVLNDDNCGHDKWVFEKVDNDYRIRHLSMVDRFLNIQGGTLILSVVNSLFFLVKQANGSYRIGLKDESLDENNPNYTSRELIDSIISECITNEYTVDEIINEFANREYIDSYDLDVSKHKYIDNGLLSATMLEYTIKEERLILDEEYTGEDFWDFEYRNNLSLFLYYTLNKIEDCLYLKQNENIVDTGNLIEDDYHFEFYLEATDNNLFMENSATYTEDGKFITSTTDTNFNTTLYDIDPLTGLTNSVTDPIGNTTYTAYDDKKRVTEITNHDKKVEYTYNDRNLLDSIKEGAKEYKFTYDDFLNTKTVKIGDIITLITNNYEENNGNITSAVYGNGHTISYDYDEFDRIKTLTKMDNTYHYKYSGEGELLKVRSDNEKIKYTYDLSKKLNEYQYNHFNISYTYGLNDNLTSKIYKLDNQNHYVENTFDKDDNIVSINHDDIKTNYIYDTLGRLVNKTTNDVLNTDYEYITNGKRTTLLVKALINNNGKYSYTYDKLNNITHIHLNGVIQNRYYYDEYNQLIEEKNYLTNEHIIYEYDNSGNILSKEIRDLTNDNIVNTSVYEYNNPLWEDQLTKFNNKTITYDEIGNPITIGSDILTWTNGRQLASYKNINDTVTYKYNVDGIRTSKTVNGITTNYYLEGSNIIYEDRNGQVIYYMYDEAGVLGMKINNQIYHFIKNLQCDIIKIIDTSNNEVASYRYDSWGNVTVTNNTISNIGDINPFRYRGYYYDSETALYYLNSRYYNPEWARFLNADGILGANKDSQAYNLYSYCSNNCVAFIDSNGNWINLNYRVKPNYSYSVSKDQNEAGEYKVTVVISDKKYYATMADDVIRFNFSKNGLLSSITIAVLAEALYKAHLEKFSHKLEGRTIRGLYTELMFHQIGYILPDINGTKAKATVSDMGSVKTDSNAKEFERTSVQLIFSMPHFVFQTQKNKKKKSSILDILVRGLIVLNR